MCITFSFILIIITIIKKKEKKEKIASLNTCEQLLSRLQIHANLNLKVNTMRGRLERRQKECKREEIEYKQGKII